MTKEQQEARIINKMGDDLVRLRKERDAYRNFTNAVDDYFEYRCISEVDQTNVQSMLEILTYNLTKPAK